ncbi:hypothetical protein [Streptomyces sp. SID2119]|uniref:hypothetical protein n=1 Tax=Streptomyces sp. SID2119 TaxID=2690253 RepID=UPI00136A39F3|nr:hypothetical protein [Streptomyces sp. SID2119]MYW28347.1 hypothetical protein [Streptomyces sp. SID2119]
MSERRFKDQDGDTWTEFEPGMLRLTERVGGSSLFVGTEDSIDDVKDAHGPLTEIRPDTDVRALLADVLEELANDVLEDYWDATDPTSERIYGKIAHRIRGRALKLREGSA